MTSNDKPQERVDPNAADVSATDTRARGNNDVSDGRAPYTSPDGRGQTGNANTVVTGPTLM